MLDGVDVGVVGEGLRSGSQVAVRTADAAGAVAGGLAGVALDAAAFGQVDQAGPLAVALRGVVGEVRGIAELVSERHADLSRRAGSTAGQGDQLVDATTNAAAGAVR